MSDGPFELRTCLTRGDYNEAIRRRRWTTGVRYVELLVSALAILAAVGEAANGDWVLAAATLAYAMLLLINRWGALHRWFFYWRRHPGSPRPARLTVSDEGIVDSDDVATLTTTWTAWKSYLLLGDALVLMTSVKGNTNVLLAPRAGLEDPDRWPDLVKLVSSRVPLQPHANRAEPRWWRW